MKKQNNGTNQESKECRNQAKKERIGEVREYSKRNGEKNKQVQEAIINEHTTNMQISCRRVREEKEKTWFYNMQMSARRVYANSRSCEPFIIQI